MKTNVKHKKVKYNLPKQVEYNKISNVINQKKKHITTSKRGM